MKFGKDTKNGYLLDTEVENIFISEHMVVAPGDYVKVYLYVLMCAETGQSVSEDRLAKLLMMDTLTVEKGAALLAGARSNKTHTCRHRK